MTYISRVQGCPGGAQVSQLSYGAIQHCQGLCSHGMEQVVRHRGLLVPFIATDFSHWARLLPTCYAFHRLARRSRINARATAVNWQNERYRVRHYTGMIQYAGQKATVRTLGNNIPGHCNSRNFHKECVRHSLGLWLDCKA